MQRLLNEILAPTDNSPYISSDQIDENDVKIKTILTMTNKLIVQL